MCRVSISGVAITESGNVEGEEQKRLFDLSRLRNFGISLVLRVGSFSFSRFVTRRAGPYLL